jgi:hypothetical protein
MGMFSPRRLFSSRNYFSNWGGKTRMCLLHLQGSAIFEIGGKKKVVIFWNFGRNTFCLMDWENND